MFNAEKTYGKNVHLYGFYWGDLNTTYSRGTFKGSIKKHKLLRVLYNNCISREINHYIYNAYKFWLINDQFLVDLKYLYR